MNQARGVLPLQLAHEACLERTGELPAAERSELALAAFGARIRGDSWARDRFLDAASAEIRPLELLCISPRTLSIKEL